MNLKTLLLSILITCPVGNLLAQKKLKMSNKYIEKTKGYEIVADNPFPGHRVVEVTFSSSSNMNCSEGNKSFTKTIAQGFGLVAKISPTFEDQKIDFRYSYTSVAGCKKNKVIQDYPYSIPLTSGQVSQLKELTYLGNEYGAYDPPRNWYAVEFGTEKGDTIIAARRGIVVDVISDKVSGKGDGNLSFSKEKNYLTIEHKDCSIANYAMFAKDGIFVKPGDYVEVGDPIGVIDGSGFTTGSHLRFSVYYYDLHPKFKEGEQTDENFYYAYVLLQFRTKDGDRQIKKNEEVEVIFDPELITHEMSKRELKKRKKKTK